MPERALYFFAGVLVGWIAVLSTGVLDATTFPYREVIVRTEEIEAREPPARPPTIVERAVNVFPDPELIARAPGGASELTARFCAPVAVLDRDTVTVTDTLFLARSLVFDEAGFFTPWQRDAVRFAGPANTGDLEEYSYRTRGSFDVRFDVYPPTVRYGRFNVLEDVLDTGARAWALYSLLSAGFGAF